MLQAPGSGSSLAAILTEVFAGRLCRILQEHRRTCGRERPRAASGCGHLPVRRIRLDKRRRLDYLSGQPCLPMLVVQVHVQVKPEAVEAFKAASLENARQSIGEPGIARFDVVQQADDPTRFVLIEAYRTAAAPAAHKETAHYQRWRDAVAPMMAAPRTSVKFANVFPADAGW